MADSDRELLELAAKAAGVRILQRTPGYWTIESSNRGLRGWNPLLDDGDALRLAVKLGMGVIQWTDGVVSATHAPTNREFAEPCGSDPCAATRRAIVRAAASIGGKEPQ